MRLCACPALGSTTARSRMSPLAMRLIRLFPDVTLSMTAPEVAAGPERLGLVSPPLLAPRGRPLVPFQHAQAAAEPRSSRISPTAPRVGGERLPPAALEA